MRFQAFVRWIPYLCVGVAVGAALLADTPLAKQPRSAGCFFGGGGSAGGVSIDPHGALSNADASQRREFTEARSQALKRAGSLIEQRSSLRKVSLRGLEAAIARHLDRGDELPAEVQLLAGLQEIRYVFVDPEQNDIILAGFGEGWTVDGEDGSIVGTTTGRPVLLLDDLLVALRWAEISPGGTITCSIDPTPQGLSRLSQYASQLATIGNPQETVRTIEATLGPQMITLLGVPDTSHFARVLVAADYRMKRLGMGFEVAAVAGLPSYLQLMPVGGRGMQSMTPRWWMVPNYGGIARDEAGLGWELHRAAVKTLTEETFFSENGKANRQPGKVNPAAQRWADLFTAKYNELATAEPIFGQLRNCMDLALVAALLTSQGLLEKAGHGFELLFDGPKLPTEEFLPPKQTQTQASVLKRGTRWVISASGGVRIAPNELLKQAEVDAALSGKWKSQLASRPKQPWWWDN